MPQGAGHLSGLVEIDGDTKGAVSLSAEGFPPIEVNPASLKLESATPGALNVRNISNRVVTLAIDAPTGIVPLGSVTLKPGEVQAVSLLAWPNPHPPSRKISSRFELVSLS